MKHCLALLCLSFPALFFGQKVEKMELAMRKYAQDSLQEIYFNRIFSDEITECFQASPELFLAEWSKFSRGVAKYIHEKNFTWGQKTTAMVDVYFNRDEKIDHFFISVKDPSFPEDKYRKLMALLEDFSKEYKFTIDAAIPFSNSGSIIFYD
ncbi:MAG: hypothetical protein K0R65_67 [Crocinitomicaceae bacterium]|jgi:histidinol phosphatase-like enzyme|nr:hypothetical protein [Crocinitomicaceae bacterium]